MMTDSLRRTLLEAVLKHDGQWGWYQFERAYPPGFLEESEGVAITKLLAMLEQDGLVVRIPAEPQARYALTDKGRESAGIG